MVTTRLRQRLFGVLSLVFLVVPTNCSGTYCSDPGPIPNGDRRFIKDGHSYYEDTCCPPGTMVIYACHDRHEIEGREVIHCNDDGSWTDSAPNCAEYPCRRFYPGDHIHVDTFDVTNDTTFPVGTVINFRCESGYQMQGLSSVLCVETGWFGKPPKCEQYTCSRFDPGPHLHVDMFEDTSIMVFPQDTVITFMCEKHYALKGISMSKCLYGHWRGPVPTCEAFQICPDPYLKFGHFIGACCDPGASVTFFCDEENDFHLQGARSATCLLTGAWSEPIPTCKSQGCSRFETGPHLFVNEFQGTDSGVFRDGTIITYRCETGYTLFGPSTSLCAEGVWLGRTQKCERQACSRFETEQHLYVKEFQATNGSVFYEATIITYRCETGYVLFGPRSSLCTQGVWLGRTQNCEEVRCGLLKTPTHGYMDTTNSTAVGVKANFSCKKGYVLVGSAERFCLEEGQWDGTPARCLQIGMDGVASRVFCPDPGTPDNGFRIMQGHFVPGSTVRFGCNQGYHRRGDSTVECLPNGTWSSTLPHCIGRYYFDETEVVLREIDGILNNASSNYGGAFVYIVFDNLSTTGTENFRHIISLAKAITTKLLMTSGRYHVGIISLGRNVDIVVNPRERMTLNVTLERLDVIPYTYGTSASTELTLRKRWFGSPGVRRLTTIRKGPYPAFSLIYGPGPPHDHLSFSEESLVYLHWVGIFCIGIRGDSEYAGLWRAPSLQATTLKFMLRDYDAIKLLADAITQG